MMFFHKTQCSKVSKRTFQNLVTHWYHVARSNVFFAKLPRETNVSSRFYAVLTCLGWGETCALCQLDAKVCTMDSYEAEQQRLLKLWQETLSDEDEGDEESMFGDVYLNDEYQVSDSESSSADEIEPPKKKLRSNNSDRAKAETSSKDLPSTSFSPDTVKQRDSSAKIHHVDEIIESVIANSSQGVGLDEDDDNTQDNTIARRVAAQNQTIQWGPVTGNNLRNFTFTENNRAGFHQEMYGTLYNKTPYDFFKYFVTDEMLNMIVEQTNLYALQSFQDNIHPHARITSWHDTDLAEIEKFFGLIIWMGLCRLPSLQCYWSRIPLYKNELPEVMSRNRFQLLLKNVHFDIIFL